MHLYASLFVYAKITDMKNRKQRRILRRTKRDYQQIVTDISSTAHLPFYLPDSYKPGEMFKKFSLYEENRQTYTDIRTEYLS